ncbi:L-threonylcarbamoyladenylate synthase [Polycladidibacter hongkongensis]|uniref:L-threonylcarbamoyladenylate synthase n=1 Tax=Polycladidibacter hongkongensis TaxID=1647556 RepID=UPI00082FD145|nr:L-threonylcarbamoyladenylate synthase [Pseudovibrio hongkongensis]
MYRWKVDQSAPDFVREAPFRALCDALLRGELAALPTETVYGLAADAINGEACARIYAAKGRPQFNPLISHVADVEAACKHGELDERALILAERFWPGALTLVVPKRAGSPVSELVTAGLDSIALRVPDAPLMQELTRALDRPLAAPSANLSGKISGTTADDVAADLGDKLAFLVDSGPTQVGVESTIVSLVGPQPTLLRPGGMAREALEDVLGCSLVRAGSDDSAPAAPGMMSSHYAPESWLRLNATQIEAGEVALLFGPVAPDGLSKAKAQVQLSASGDLVEAAARLFRALRKADSLAAGGRIAATPVPLHGLGEAINDRLQRAAAPRG